MTMGSWSAAPDFDIAAQLPPSLTLPHKGGGDMGAEGSLSGQVVRQGADLRAVALMFGSDVSTSSPPPLWGRDREGGTQRCPSIRPADGEATR